MRLAILFTFLAAICGLQAADCLSPYPAAKVIYHDRIIFANADNQVIICSLKSKKILRKFDRPAGPVDSLAIEQSGAYVMASGYGNHLKLFHLPSSRVTSVIDRDTWAPVQIAGSLLSKSFFTTDGSSLVVHDRADGKKLARYNNHRQTIETLAISNRGRYLVTASAGKTLVWQRDNLALKPGVLPMGHVRAVAFNHDDSEMYLAVHQNKSQVFRVNTSSLTSQKIFEENGAVSQMHLDEANDQLVMRVRRKFLFFSLNPVIPLADRLKTRTYSEYKIGQAHFWKPENALVSFELGSGALKIWQIDKGGFSPRLARSSTKVSGSTPN